MKVLPAPNLPGRLKLGTPELQCAFMCVLQRAAGNNTIIVRNCTFSGNNCTQGCGISVSGGFLSVRSSLVEYNNALNDGAGLQIINDARAVIQDSNITSNVAGSDGGGIFMDWSDVVLERVTINGNAGDRNGGGIACSFLKDVRVFDTNISHNRAQHGAGVWCDNPSVAMDLFDSSSKRRKASPWLAAASSMMQFHRSRYADRMGGAMYRYRFVLMQASALIALVQICVQLTQDPDPFVWH